MIKFFDDQYKTHGFHNWTCQNCTVAYHKFNVRICKLEKRIDTMDSRVEENTKKNLDTSDKLELVNKEVSTLKENIKTTKQGAVNDATRAWSAELREREGRKNNLVIYGLQEPGTSIVSGLARKKEDEAETMAMFSDMCAVVEDKDIKFAHRLGPIRDDIETKPRPLRICFRDNSTLETVFDKARNLPRTRFRGVSLTPDLTELQRTEDQDLMTEADNLNNEMSEEDRLNWTYRCTGRRGQRLICKLKVRPRTNAARPGQTTRTGPAPRTEMETDTEDMTDMEDNQDHQDTRQRNKRTRQEGSPELSPQTRRAAKQTRPSNH